MSQTGMVLLTALERAVVETVAYSDVFDYPLTLDEVWQRLPAAASQDDVAVTLKSASEMVETSGPYHMLSGREALIATRERRHEASRRLMRRAERYGRWIARLPFVRMVAVTGSLAVDNAEEGDDVDYLVVTAPGRVWLARALVMAIVRLAALRGLTLCPNYLLAETALALPERDVYTARELLQMRPLAGLAVYERMLVANAWALALLPNWPPPSAAFRHQRGWLQRPGEALLGGRLGDALERWLLRRKAAEFRARAAVGGSEAVFTADVCKGHFDAHRARLEAELTRRLAALGVDA